MRESRSCRDGVVPRRCPRFTGHRDRVSHIDSERMYTKKVMVKNLEGVQRSSCIVSASSWVLLFRIWAAASGPRAAWQRDRGRGDGRLHTTRSTQASRLWAQHVLHLLRQDGSDGTLTQNIMTVAQVVYDTNGPQNPGRREAASPRAFLHLRHRLRRLQSTRKMLTLCNTCNFDKYFEDEVTGKRVLLPFSKVRVQGDGSTITEILWKTRGNASRAP